MSTKIAVSSGKGGTGKTFVAANIAAICAEEGKKPPRCFMWAD